MRELTLGLEVVLPDGRVWNGLRGLAQGQHRLRFEAAVHRRRGHARHHHRRDAQALSPAARGRDRLSGLDPRRGCDAAFRPRPGRERRSVDGVRTDAAHRHRQSRWSTCVICAIRSRRRHDWYVLLEVSSSQTDSGLRGALEDLLAAGDGRPRWCGRRHMPPARRRRNELWRIREGLAEAQGALGGSIKHDVSVPVSRVAEFIAQGQRRGERDDCPASAPIPSAMSATATSTSTCPSRRAPTRPCSSSAGPSSTASSTTSWSSMGGSISAEHGIGLVKIGELEHYARSWSLN